MTTTPKAWPPMAFFVLGGGAVTQELYLPALRVMGRLGATTIVEAAPSEQLMREAHGARVVRADFRDWLEAEPARAGCLIVALPNRLHGDAARLALTRGWHVLAEKPLALTAHECEELGSLAETQGRLLKVAMSRRYLASLRLAREMVLGNEVGDVVAIAIEDRLPFTWRPRSPAFFEAEAGGVLADMGVHYLDFVETVVGPLTPVDYTDDARGGVEGSASFRLLAGRVPVDIRLSRLDGRTGCAIIKGTRGEIAIDKVRENEAVLRRPGAADRRIVVERPFADASWPHGFVGSFAQMLHDTERAIRGEATPLADARDAARTAASIEWAYANRPAAPTAHGVALRRAVLVTGATGFIGGHLVERLNAEGERVRVAARSLQRCANVARFPVDLRLLDVLDAGAVAAAVRGCRIVYHLAAGRDEPHAARITTDGTRHVVEAAIAAGAECVVVVSSMYVLGFPKQATPVNEDASYRPYGGAYGRSKAAMERWCLRRARTSGATRIVVLNPTCVIGPGGGAYTALPVDLAAQGRLRWIEAGRGMANYVYVGNLVDALLLAGETRSAHGERFIVNDGTVTWRELLEPLVRPLGREVGDCSGDELRRLAAGQNFRVRDLLRAAGRSPEIREALKRSALVRRAHAALGRHDGGRVRRAAVGGTLDDRGADVAAEAPPAWLAGLYGSWQTRFSAAKAERVLGWRPRVTLEEAQAACLAWLIESGRLPPPSAAPLRHVDPSTAVAAE